MTTDHFEYKSTSLGSASQKAGSVNLDEMQGIVECFVAGIGNKDSVGDICASGAFTKSLQRRKPRVVWGHNWNDPIGKVLEIYEVPPSDPRLPLKMKIAGIGGLFAKVQFNLQSEKGREAFTMVAFFGEEQEWSIGYKTLRAQYDQKSQANVIYELELYEVSPVLHGANQLTGTISVKTDDPYGEDSSVMMMDDEKPNKLEIEKQLSGMLGAKISLMEMDDENLTFARRVADGSVKRFKCGWSRTGGRMMFGPPEEIVMQRPSAPQTAPMMVPPNEPRRMVRPQQMPSMPIAVKPGMEGVVVVPLPAVQYEEGNNKPIDKNNLDKEEADLRDALLKIVKRHGKFNEDKDGVWAGYKPASENPIASIGVKCANCVFFQNDGSCKIVDMDIEPEGKCRFAVIPKGVVNVDGIAKKEYEIEEDANFDEAIEDLEVKYPGEFVMAMLRGAVGKRKKKRSKFKSLSEFGKDDNSFDEQYCIPLHPNDAFRVKQEIDPILDYYMVDAEVDIDGIVLKSGVSLDFIEAVDNALENIKKKFLDSSEFESKAIGRRLGSYVGSRLIDRPSIGGRRDRRNRRGDIDMPTGGTPGNRRPTGSDFDPDNDGWVDEGTTRPRFVGVQDAKPATPSKPFSSGAEKRSRFNTSRHGLGKETESKFGVAPDEQARREAFDKTAQEWVDKGFGWEEVPRYQTDNTRSAEFLRGRELGYNQARRAWQGDDKKRPAKFNEKAKSGQAYQEWYYDFVRTLGTYLDATNKYFAGKDKKDKNKNYVGEDGESQFLKGLDSALRSEVYERRPSTGTWDPNDKETLARWMNSYGFDGASPNKPDRKLSSGRLPALDDDFDPDNPYGDDNLPFDESGTDTYDRIIRDFLGEEMPRPKRGKIAPPEKNPEDYTDQDIYEERMNGVSIEDMAKKLGVTRTEVRQAEQRYMSEIRRGSASRTAESAPRLSSGFENFLKKPENKRTRREKQDYLGPLWEYRDGQTLSSGKDENQEADAARIKDMYQQMGEAIIAALDEILKDPSKAGQWQVPWRSPELYGRNPTRRNRIYQGMNQLILSQVASKRKYKTNRWAGRSQWRELNKKAKPKPGELGVNILVPFDIKNDDGIRTGEKGFKIETVFNADQMDGLPAWVYEVKETEKLDAAQRLEDIENVIKEIGPRYKEQGVSAFYDPNDDTINVPPFENFIEPIAFYGTVLHEIIHWTAHPSRLKRDLSGRMKGTPEQRKKYAFEELIAEIGASFAMGFLGVEPQIREDHIQYLAFWRKALQDDPSSIRRAIEGGQQAVDYIMNKSATLRKRAGVPDSERKGKEDYTIEAPIVGRITIPIPKKKPVVGTPTPENKVRQRVRVRGQGPSAVKTILEDYENNRLSSGITGFVIKDEEGNTYNQINKRLSSGRGPIVGAKDPKRKIERTEGSFMEMFGMKFEPTDEQKDVMDTVAHFTKTGEGGLAAVRAGAGAGKTTTVEQSVIRMAKESPESQFYYITFNKKNAAEAARRMPDNTGSSSINQLAYWSLLLEDRPGISPEFKEKLKKIGIGAGNEYYSSANPKSTRQTSAEGYGGKTVDTTGLKKAGFRTLGYVSFETESGGRDVARHYDFGTKYPDGLTHEGVELTADDYGLVLINALTRYSQSDDDALSEKHFKLRPHEIERNKQLAESGDPIDPAETAFDQIPQEWVDLALKMWSDTLDPKSNVLPNYDQQVKIWAMQKPNLRTDAGMVGHGTRKVKDARAQDKKLDPGSIVQVDGVDYVYTGGGARAGLRRRYATEDKPISTFFFDEAQDVNPVLQKVIEDNIANNNLAIVMVGDPRQSIYGFRGSSDSFARLNPDFNLTLTDSFRYGKTVAFLGNLMLGRGNMTDRQNGIDEVSADYKLFGRLQDVVSHDFNLGTLTGNDLRKKLDSIQKKYGISGPDGQSLADMPEKERNELLDKARGYIVPESEGILYRQIPTSADGTWAYISYSNKNTLTAALEFIGAHPDKIVGLPAEKYRDMVEFLRHYQFVLRPVGTRPRESKIIGNAWTMEEIRKRAGQKSSYGQLGSMLKLLQVRDAEGNQLSPLDWLNRLLGRRDPQTGEVLTRARIREIEEPLDVDPFKNIDGSSSTVSGEELIALGKQKAGKGGGGAKGAYKMNRDKRFNIIPNPTGQTPSREVFWKLDTESLGADGKWENGVIISGEGIIDVYQFRDAAGKIQYTGDKNGEKPMMRRRIEKMIKDLNLEGKVTIEKQYVPRKAGSSNAPAYDAVRIKGDNPEETGLLLSLVGRMITDSANEPEVDASFLTTHAAKGLEFDNVVAGDDFFQPKFEDDGSILPGNDISREMENLIYVMMTRAKKRIQLSEATSWIIDPKKNPKGFEYIEKFLTEEQQAPSGFWNPFGDGEQVFPDGAREILSSGRVNSVPETAVPGTGTNRSARRARLRGGDVERQATTETSAPETPGVQAPERTAAVGGPRSVNSSNRADRKARRMSSGSTYADNINATNLAAIRGSKTGESFAFARRFWDGFRKRGITLDTSSKSGTVKERRRQINEGLDKAAAAMKRRPQVTIGRVSGNENLSNPDADTWMLPVKSLKESIRIPTEFDVVRNPDNTIADVKWTKSEPISNTDLSRLLNLSPEDAKRISDDDSGISHNAVRFLVAELGNRPEFGGWRLFSPVTSDEPGVEKMSSAQRFAENLGRANMRDRFIIETFGKDAYPFWADREENQIISSDEYSTLGEVDPVAKFRATGRFTPNPEDADGEASAEADLIYEGMPDFVPEAPAPTVNETNPAGAKTSRRDFKLDNLIENLGLDRDEWMAQLRERMKRSFGMDDVGLTNPKDRKSWESDGVPVAAIQEMIRTGMIENAESVWPENGQKLDGELRASKANVAEAMVEFISNTQKGSGGNTKRNKEYILGTSNLSVLLNNAAKTRGKTFSKIKGDEPRYSSNELQDVVNRFNEIFGTSHTIEDIFSKEQLENARKRLQEEGRTMFGKSGTKE